MKRLIGLYPARWRERYGAEMASLLDDLAPSTPAARLSMAANLARGALTAHMSKEFQMTGGPGRAIARGAVLAVAAWVPLGAVIMLANVVFPATGTGEALWSLGSFLYLAAALAVIGMTAGRDSPRLWSRLVAGAVAGAVIGALVIATFAAVDNAFLPVISQQPAKIAGLHASGMTSMRAFINDQLRRQSIGVILLGAAFGTALAGLCGAGRAAPSPQRGR